MTWTDLKEKLGVEIFLNAVIKAKENTQKYKDYKIQGQMIWEVLRYAEKYHDLLDQENSKECRWIAEWRTE